MRKITLTILVTIIIVSLGRSQTLNVPDNIGTSNNAGKVGIGTNTPNSLLETKSGNSDSDEILARFIHRANSIEAGAGIQLGGVNNDTGFGVKILGYSNPHSTTNSRLSIYTSSGWNSWNLGLTQDKDGNVGIGTTTPPYKLSVEGTIGAREVIIKANSEGSPPLRINSFNHDARAFQIGFSGFHAAYINFYRVYSNVAYPFMSVKRVNGNVGIGTTNPGTYKLAVEGKIGAHEVVVTTEGWSDFVFEPDYNLMSLKELEIFIKANKHLPEIPTVAEVKENGISIGEMNAKLLQKIEELTLYVIEQNKETNVMKVQLNKLAEENELLKKEINTLKTQ